MPHSSVYRSGVSYENRVGFHYIEYEKNAFPFFDIISGIAEY